MNQPSYLSAEEAEAKEYCLHHPLERPAITGTKAVLFLAFMELAIIALAFALSQWKGIFYVYYVIGNVVCLALFGKRLLIGAVQLYQRYAPEEVRRKCLCKPTCSEYAILALQKYNLPKAACKIYIRLFKTCRGIHYGIDYP